jgi:hypothetical protein
VCSSDLAEKAEQNFRYILALHLRRRRLLKQVETIPARQAGEPRVIVFQDRANETDRYRVVEPELAESELAAVQEALTRVLSPEYREEVEERLSAAAAAAASAGPAAAAAAAPDAAPAAEKVPPQS